MLRQDGGMPISPRPVLAVSVIVAFAAFLSGCATASGTGPGSVPSESASSSDDAGLEAAWLDDGRTIAVVTLGSSTCVPSAGDTTADGQSITVALVAPPADTACTRDLVPRATLVPVPEGIDPTQDVSVTVTGEASGTTALAGDADLTATPGSSTDYATSAGWLNEDAFVILTWGSSSCAPVVESVKTAGTDALAVQFVEPAADQVCTADMAPRATIVSTAGLDTSDIQGSDVGLTLTGDGLDGTTVILGER